MSTLLSRLSKPAWLRLPRLPVEADGPERSARFRAAVLINSLFAFWAYGTVDPEMPLWLPALAVIAGSLYSHWLRGRSNFWIKWGLAAGMLYVLYLALDNLVRGTIDPRLSLAQLLLWLQVLNSFDLPRRKNLRVALLVTSILMVVAGTLSRTMDYGALLLGFGFTLIWAMHEAYLSEAGLVDTPPRRVLGVSAGLLAGVIVLGFPLFMLAPRQDRQLTSYTLPMSFRIPLPATLDARVRNPMGRSGSSDATSRQGYNGFSDRLDLNIRSAPSETVVLRVRADRPQYWRAMAFDRYDGRSWEMSEPTAVDAIDGPPFRLGRPDGQTAGVALLQTFYVETDQANVIFGAWNARQVYFPTALIWRDRYDGLRAPVPLQKDMYYSVVSETPIFNAAALAKEIARPVPPRLTRYLALPPSITARTRAEVLRLTAGADTPYRRILTLRHHLSSRYTYRLDVPEAPAGREWVDHFLFERREGFCEQFATSLAVMGRVAGIPTRLVTGFVPGDYNPFSGYYEVKGKHAHAWVEAWMPGVGWLPFDPTPASGATSAADSELPNVRNPATAVLDFLFPWLAGRPWLAVGLMSAVGLVGAVVWHRWLRPRQGPLIGRPTRLYRQLRARARRLGVTTTHADTPGAWLEAVAIVPAAEPALDELRAFVRQYEAARFGQGDGTELESAAKRAEAALKGARGG